MYFETILSERNYDLPNGHDVEEELVWSTEEGFHFRNPFLSREIEGFDLINHNITWQTLKNKAYKFLHP